MNVTHFERSIPTSWNNNFEINSVSKAEYEDKFFKFLTDIKITKIPPYIFEARDVNGTIQNCVT